MWGVFVLEIFGNSRGRGIFVITNFSIFFSFSLLSPKLDQTTRRRRRRRSRRRRGAPPSLRQRLGFLAGDFLAGDNREEASVRGEARRRSKRKEEVRFVLPSRHSGESCCDLFVYSPHVIVIHAYHACFRTRHFLVHPYCRHP